MERRFTVAPPVMIQRARVRLSRLGVGAERTHLQQIDLIRRSLKEANWPVKKISCGPAISVGVESLAEYCDAQLSSRFDLKIGKEELARRLPEGYAVLDVKSVPRFFPSLEESINVCTVEINTPLLEGTLPKWEAFEATSQFVVIKKKAEKNVAIDARDRVKTWKLEGSRLELTLRFGPGKTLKPERIAQAVCEWPEDVCQMGTPQCQLAVKRLQFYFEKDSGDLISI